MSGLLIQIVIVLVLVGGIFGKVYYTGVKNGKADCVAAYEAADAELRQRAEKAEADAANKLVDMEAAYDAGKKEARIIYRKIEAKGVENVATKPEFARPECVVGDDSMLAIISARAGMRSPTDPAAADAAVRAAPPAK